MMGCEACSAPCKEATGQGSRTTSTPKRPTADAVVALIGQPNSGKSTLFNGLTGARQHVGNWPGKTVEFKSGIYRFGKKSFEIVDLPGSYALAPNSAEEEVTCTYATSGAADVALIFADASQLERSLYMLASFAGTDCPTVLIVNMMDVAQRQGKTVDCSLLEQRLGIPVVPMVASDRSRYDTVGEAIEKALNQHLIVRNPPAVDREAEETQPEAVQQNATVRFRWIEHLLEGAVTESSSAPRLSKFDRIAIGSKLSKPFTILMILVGFLLAFVPAMPVMAIGGAVSSLGQEVAILLTGTGAPDAVGSFLSGVVFNSLCFGIMMVGYVLGINLVFGIYEEVGYMARISYVFDNTMARFGLQGKSVMPFLMCLGCTMGGVSGSRVVDSWGQRMLTVAMAWAIPCASTWGVVPVLAVAFFGWGAPLVVVAIFAVTLLLMWIAGKVFGPRLVPADARKGLVMEMPPYHKPRLGGIVRTACLKSWQMFKRAIKVVAVFAFVIWLLTYSPTGGVEGSLLYAIGKAIEPITLFFGLTWQTFTAWLCALVIKESALGVLSGLFAGTGTANAAVIGAATGTAVVAGNIGELMAQAISAPAALAFIFAFTFNVPCSASVSATYAEVHSMKWTVAIIAFYIVASLLLGCVVYHVALLFF